MDYKVLYRKYRPTCFDEIIGQNYTIQMLKNAFLNNKLSHAFIFTGPRGTGKTSTAKLLAKLVNCENPVDGKPCNKCNSCLNINDNPDVIEIDAASNTGVDNIREIINNCKIAPSFSKYKVYIIDEVHMLSTSAFNALLLTLEEPPKNIIFILATTEIQNVPITILSRCQRFDFSKISTDTIYEQLKKVVKLEKIKIDDDAIKEIASIADGGMRDAYSILDQISKNDTKITIDDINKSFGIISNNQIAELINNVENSDIDKIITKINEFSDSSTNYMVIVNKIIAFLNEKIKNYKLGNENGNYNLYKKLIFDLLTLYNIKSVDNPYSILEIILLDNCSDNKNYFPGNNFQELQTVKPVEKEEKIVENNNNNEENKIEDVIEEDNSFVSIRINNTFVEANKTIKAEVNKMYTEFLLKVDSYYKNILEDSIIEVASNTYAIIVFEHEATANVANNNIKDIEEQFEKIIGQKIKFVCISKEHWNRVAEEYKTNLKKKIKYEYIDELNDDNKNIFDASIVEIV
ncbi:MAG: DNA polymerase III subunit gamma/tau [Bacilli bacterium]|nr:DNA polymerase III subunit gamma/tau [Bacilli bacterium]